MLGDSAVMMAKGLWPKYHRLFLKSLYYNVQARRRPKQMSFEVAQCPGNSLGDSLGAPEDSLGDSLGTPSSKKVRVCIFTMSFRVFRASHLNRHDALPAYTLAQDSSLHCTSHCALLQLHLRSRLWSLGVLCPSSQCSRLLATPYGAKPAF